jgi:hypothetical protein
MATVTVQNTLPDSANKSDFYSIVNNSTVTGIVNADLSPSAAVVDTKLATINTAGKVDGSAITNLTNVPSGAGVIPAVNLPNSIADSHLATISTAGKVSGAALTSLTATPSGAGIIPIANLASGTPTGSKYIRDDGTLQTVTVTTKNVISGSAPAVTTSTSYMASGAVATTIDTASVPMAVAGTMKNLYVYTKNTTASTVDVTVLKNGSASALTCQIQNAATTANDTTHTVSFSVGDRFEVQIGNNRGVTINGFGFSVEYDT